MELTAYLTKYGLSQREFGARLGVTQGMVAHWVNGRTRITAERALEIEAATSGEVSRLELRPDVFGAPAARASWAERRA
jgi:DNA-binding transcriptional regulator YdaS (Cro superfamily)